MLGVIGGLCSMGAQLCALPNVSFGGPNFLGIAAWLL